MMHEIWHENDGWLPKQGSVTMTYAKWEFIIAIKDEMLPELICLDLPSIIRSKGGYNDVQ